MITDKLNGKDELKKIIINKSSSISLNNNTFKSFLIEDILSSPPPSSSSSTSSKSLVNIKCSNLNNKNSIIRPWNLEKIYSKNHYHYHHFLHYYQSDLSYPLSISIDEESDYSDQSEAIENCPEVNKKSVIHQSSSLNALFQLTEKAFDSINGNKSFAASSDMQSINNGKKKRKSRTAFTNYQIFQLEKRFIYQKYLSSSDRDELASTLGLTNGQVITWFQNRRAKYKRDNDEFRKDIDLKNYLPSSLSPMRTSQTRISTALISASPSTTKVIAIEKAKISTVAETPITSTTSSTNNSSMVTLDDIHLLKKQYFSNALQLQSQRSFC